MAKKRERLVMPEEYIAAYEKIASSPAGKNWHVFNFSGMPKSKARAMLNKLASESPYLIKTKGGAYQRTNASGKPVVNDIVNGIESINERAESIKAQAKPKQPKPYNSNTKAKERKMSTSEVKARTYETKVDIARIQASIDKRPFNEDQARKDAYAAVYGEPKPAVVKNDVSVANNPEAVNPGKVDLQDALKPIAGLAKRSRLVRALEGNALKLANVSQPSAVLAVNEGSALTADDIVLSGVTAEFKKAASKVVYSNEVLEEAPELLQSHIADASGQVWKELDKSIVSGGAFCSAANSIAGNALITEVGVTNVASLALSDINALLVAGKGDPNEQPVLVFSSSLFRGAISDLLSAAGMTLAREDGKLFWQDHEVILSDGLAGASATTSGEVLAVAGSLRRGVTLVERSPMKVELKKELLAVNDQTLAVVSARYGVGIADPNSIARLVIS
jgi:HK97 family phage major capsid protein